MAQHHEIKVQTNNNSNSNTISTHDSYFLPFIFLNQNYGSLEVSTEAMMLLESIE